MSRTNMQIKKVNVKGPKKLFSMKECSLFIDLVFKNKYQTKLINLIQAYFIMQKKDQLKMNLVLLLTKIKYFIRNMRF